MVYPNYKFSYPYDIDSEKTTGYSGPMIISYNNYNSNGIIDAIDNRNLVRLSIERIIGTSKGERVMRPNFGCNLKRLLFEPLDNFLLEDIKNTLKYQLSLEEPRIIVENVEVKPIIDTLTINVSISFRFKNQNISDKFDFSIKY